MSAPAVLQGEAPPPVDARSVKTDLRNFASPSAFVLVVCDRPHARLANAEVDGIPVTEKNPA
jgi:hypothetical protein